MYDFWQAYKHDIIKGFSTGIFGGLGVFLIKLLWDYYLYYRDEKRCYKFIKNNTAFGYWSTRRIASETNLTEGRVNQVCSASKRIVRNKNEKETWSLRRQLFGGSSQ
jgi:hypothetical protein